jgi:uncharacterized protein
MKRKISLVLTSLILIIMLVATGCTPSEKRQIEILGGEFGLPNYTAMVAVADILNKYAPEIKASVVETTGSEANISMAEERDPNQVLYTLTDTDYFAALRALPPWEEEHTDMRWIAGMQRSFMGIVTIDPNITTPQDLRGKSFAIMPGPSAGSNAIYEEYLREEGIWDSMDIQRMGIGAFYDALNDGLIDACALLMTEYKGGWGPVFLLEELISSKGELVRCVSMDPDKLAQAIENTGLEHDVITVPAGSLTDTCEACVGWGILTTGLACQKDADEEFIYAATKTLAENLVAYGESYPANANLTKELMVDFLPAENESEVHPGALKYYKENGIWPTN